MSKFFLPLLSFSLATNFISAGEIVSVKNSAGDKSSMIQQALQDEQRDFFAPRGLQLDLLKNCPQVIPILAEWLYDEWHTYDASLTKEILVHAFSTRLNNDRIPITFVTLKNGNPIGLISLKRETSPEFLDFPENSLWIGGLQVVPEERNQGLGRELLKFAATIAKSLGYEQLYFYTSNPKNVNWYLKQNAQIIEVRSFRNHTITIMYIPLHKENMAD